MDVMTGVIDHRILLNYRVDPDLLQTVLPEPLKPKLVDGWGIGGICQVSLSRMRPRGIPAIVGSKSHNAAHRIAVIHEGGEGVYVPRRDTDSRLNQFSGGRLFPGLYQYSDFKVKSAGPDYKVVITDREGVRIMSIDATVTENDTAGSVFPSLAAASAFFLGGNIGWSPGSDPAALDTIELWTREWRMEPLAVASESSSYFRNQDLFPSGSVEFDSGFIMRDLEHEWRAQEGLACVCS
ncbi:MAG: acetoacetate decarboxylase family protein [Deltaproteobacteria bacterium]|nr:acetoacetate decarboxylase family protein [Deltaproteobacteria bacterium]